MANILETVRGDIKNWWLLLITGIIFIIGGAITIAYPTTSYMGLAVFFGLAILFGGIFKISFAIANSNGMKGWGWTLTSGIIDLILGGILTWNPLISAAVLPFIVGFYVIYAGGILMSFGMDARSFGIDGAGWMIAGGIITMVLGVLIMFNPVAGAATLITFTSLAFFFTGVTYCIIAFRFRRLKKKLHIH